LAKPKSRRAKRKGGLGEMNFCPPVVPQSGTGGGKRFRNSALAEYQNRKIFVSLIEKGFGKGAIKKMFRKFFCFARRSPAPKRSLVLDKLRGHRAETLGGIVARRATIKSQCQDFVQKKF